MNKEAISPQPVCAQINALLQREAPTSWRINALAAHVGRELPRELDMHTAPTVGRNMSSTGRPNDTSAQAKGAKLAPAPQDNVILPKWSKDEIDKKLEECAKLLKHWEEHMNKTDKMPKDQLLGSADDLGRHVNLKRKLHDTLGIMARMVQNQVKLRKPVDPSLQAAGTAATGTPATQAVPTAVGAAQRPMLGTQQAHPQAMQSQGSTMTPSATMSRTAYQQLSAQPNFQNVNHMAFNAQAGYAPRPMYSQAGPMPTGQQYVAQAQPSPAAGGYPSHGSYQMQGGMPPQYMRVGGNAVSGVSAGPVSYSAAVSQGQAHAQMAPSAQSTAGPASSAAGNMVPMNRATYANMPNVPQGYYVNYPSYPTGQPGSGPASDASQQYKMQGKPSTATVPSSGPPAMEHVGGSYYPSGSMYGAPQYVATSAQPGKVGPTPAATTGGDGPNMAQGGAQQHNGQQAYYYSHNQAPYGYSQQPPGNFVYQQQEPQPPPQAQGQTQVQVQMKGYAPGPSGGPHGVLQGSMPPGAMSQPMQQMYSMPGHVGQTHGYAPTGMIPNGAPGMAQQYGQSFPGPTAAGGPAGYGAYRGMPSGQSGDVHQQHQQHQQQHPHQQQSQHPHQSQPQGQPTTR